MPSRASHSSMTGSSSAIERPFQAAVVAQEPPDLHLLVQAAFFRQVADAIARGARVGGAEHLDAPLVGQQQMHDHPQRGGLAGSVGSDEPVDRFAGHGEGEASTAVTPSKRLVTSVSGSRQCTARTFYGFDNLVKLFTL
jgi:hypothetical protein